MTFSKYTVRQIPSSTETVVFPKPMSGPSWSAIAFSIAAAVVTVALVIAAVLTHQSDLALSKVLSTLCVVTIPLTAAPWVMAYIRFAMGALPVTNETSAPAPRRRRHISARTYAGTMSTGSIIHLQA